MLALARTALNTFECERSISIISSFCRARVKLHQICTVYGTKVSLLTSTHRYNTAKISSYNDCDTEG